MSIEANKELARRFFERIGAHPAMAIRDARIEELEALSALVLRSKAVHGYDAAFMERCSEELRLTEPRLRKERVRVAVESHLQPQGVAVGVAALKLDPDEAELTALFVEPAHLGRGIGLALWSDAVDEVRRRGIRRLRVEADPYAAPWYLARGAVLRGEVPSDSIPGRVLPWLELAC